MYKMNNLCDDVRMLNPSIDVPRDAKAFADESALVFSFAAGIDRWPRSALRNGASRMLVIGNEVAVHGAGSGGSTGSIDILAVDDRGEVWLIEAKLARNTQSDPAYVFGNQLARYASGVMKMDVASIHRSLEEYLYGRRSVIKPPASLSHEWMRCKSIEEMLAVWYRAAGKQGAEDLTKKLAMTLTGRIQRGDFVLAVLTDVVSESQKQWIKEFGEPNGLQCALVSMSCGQIRVEYRSEPVFESVDDPSWKCPFFERLPQSYAPSPQTLPLMLNDTAYALWKEIVFPQLATAFGADIAMLPDRSGNSSASFGYCALMSNGLPLVLQFGRGDKFIATGGHAIAGQHSLKLQINLAFALGQIRQSDDAVWIDKKWQEIFEFTRPLVEQCEFVLKGLPSQEYCRMPPRALFLEKISRPGDEYVLERQMRSGKKDFGNSPDHVDDDSRVLSRALDFVFDSLEGNAPFHTIIRPQRSKHSSCAYRQAASRYKLRIAS